MSKIVRNLTPGSQVSITSPNGGDVYGPDGARAAKLAAGETRVLNAPGASMVLIDDAATVRELGAGGGTLPTLPDAVAQEKLAALVAHADELLALLPEDTTTEETTTDETSTGEESTTEGETTTAE